MKTTEAALPWSIGNRVQRIGTGASPTTASCLGCKAFVSDYDDCEQVMERESGKSKFYPGVIA